MQYVAEFKREMTPGEMAILSRRGTPAFTAKDARYVARWLAKANGSILSKSTPLPVLCPHLGTTTGETIGCRSCNRASPVAVYNCTLHGKTTLVKPGASNEIHCCKFCPDNPANQIKKGIQPDTTYPGRHESVGKKHLIYHLLPVANRWQWNAGELLKRWPLFTGRKVIAIMTGGEFSRGPGQREEEGRFVLDDPATVRAHFPLDAEFIEVQNDPKLREVASWIPLVESIINSDDSDAVLYAHAKGVTRATPPDEWTRWLYELAMDYPDRVDSLLAHHPIVGSFKKSKATYSGKWHYHGTFFWFRVGDIKQRPWRKVPQEWWGVEGWPGLVYHPSEGGVLFKEGGSELDLFKTESIDRVRKELETWR